MEETGEKQLKTHRSMTLDTAKNDMELGPIASGAVVTQFSQIPDEIREQVDSIDGSLFKINSADYSEETKKVLAKAMQEIRVEMLSCPEKMKDFAEKLSEVFSACSAWDGLSLNPPRIVDPTPEAKTATFILVDLLKSIKPQQAAEWVRWFSYHLIPESYKSNASFHSSIIKACCVCTRKRKVFKDDHHFWAILDIRNHFTLYEIAPTGLAVYMESDIGSIKLSRSKKTVKLFNKQGERVKRILPIDPQQNEMWANALNPQKIAKFPFFITSAQMPVPEQMLIALNEALLANDSLVVRALVHFSVAKIGQGTPLAEALFDIFAYAGKVNDLITLMASIEFAQPELTYTTVLRSNSQLTNMLKVFFHRFGRRYYDDFLKRIVLYIDSKGDMSLKQPANADSRKAQTMIFTVLRRIAGSLEHVPPEIRHLASVLKNAVAIRFNSKQATYNTLSGFFCLRYICAVLSNPLETDPTLRLHNPWTTVMVPAAQLLMTPLNLIKLSGKYDVFNSWNKTLTTKIFPMLIEFVFSLAVCDEAPVYAPPSKERLKESLNIVWKNIAESNGKFAEKYNEYVQEGMPVTALGTGLAAFLSGYFEQNF